MPRLGVPITTGSTNPAGTPFERENKHTGGGGHSQTTLWKIKKEANFTNHSTQKPLECMARPIRNHTLPGEWVYDPFVGSGTTLIAAELLKRKCLAVELNPEYVAMTILRWEILTGLKAHKK